ncbi:MAG: hypothetical protein QM784_23960 [Polyangiaceae bacterium]
MFASGARFLGQLKSQAGETSTGGKGGSSSDNSGGRSAAGASQGGASTGGTTEPGTSSGGTSSGGTTAAKTTATSGGSTGAGGATAVGGSTGTGGATAVGGSTGAGGATAVGGSAGTGGTTAACVPTISVLETTQAQCTDGIDNDCNGNVDCPVISTRYPEVGRATGGDDAMVRLLAPNSNLRLARVECRTDKTSIIGTKTWNTCDLTNPTNLTLFAMTDAAAQLAASNGVTQFDFRFVYTDGRTSDPSTMTFYSHNSLRDGSPGTPKLRCEPLATDEAYFSAARTYLVTGTTQAGFASTDVQLKNPFIYTKFTPSYIGTFTATTTPQEVRILSLRHRFSLDANRQLLLVARQYSSTRSAGKCNAAAIEVHDTYLGGITGNRNRARKYRNVCDAIVLNKAGSGVCLKVVSGIPVLADNNSSPMITVLTKLGIAWPKSDPMMWQKLVDDRPSRKTLLLFSDKCAAEDTACRTAHTGALVLPDSGNAFFSR